jgi:hypothetical protein
MKPRGSLGSSPLRSDGSCNDQVGEAGPVEQSSGEAKSLKLRAKGLSGCHPSGQQPRQPDGGARGPNKELFSQYLAQRSSSNLKYNGQKAAHQRKHHKLRKKERSLLYAPILKLQKG